MTLEAIYHRINSDYIYFISPTELVVKLRVKAKDVRSLTLHYADKYKLIRGKPHFYSVHMQLVCSDSLFDYYETVISIGQFCIFYHFEIEFETERLYYGNYQFFRDFPDVGSKTFEMPNMGERDLFRTPDWAKEAIIYEIFPERFHNGNPQNNPPETAPWDSAVHSRSFLGGDLQGIIDKLDYLHHLGVNCLYLTPIFYSKTNHKYKTIDYYQIDPHFGTLETLKVLVQKSHERGIRIILDAVFNHCDTEFFAFEDVRKRGVDSRYKDWFIIRKFPIVVKDYPDYDCYCYNGTMPRLNVSHPEVEEYFIDVATYWIKTTDIDGWRLDVASEIPHHFWREFRKAVKTVKSDALIVGEIWHDTSTWLQGEQYDTTMNYLFAESVIQFIATQTLTPEGFDHKLGFLRGLYKKQAYQILWNLLDSHDTARFLTVCQGDIRKLKLGALIQLSYTGSPMLYYGDEVGMTGGGDPDCRKGMVWDESKQNHEVLEYYRKLIGLRRREKILTHGDIFTTLIDNEANVYGYSRVYRQEKIDIVINNGETRYTFPVSGDATELLSSIRFVSGDVVTLQAKSGIIIKYHSPR